MNIQQRRADQQKETLRRLSQTGGNKFCFDCGIRGPLYVVTNFNIFVCSTCSAAHRSQQHKVKGISMSEFTEAELEALGESGNDAAQQTWLYKYHGQLPQTGDAVAVKRFIRCVFQEKQYWAPAPSAKASAPSVPSTSHPSLSHPPSHALPPPPAAPTQPRDPIRTVVAPVSSPAAPEKTVGSDFLDNLFSGPLPTPQQTCQPPAAPIVGSHATTSAPTAASSAPTPSQPSAPAVASLMDDLFSNASLQAPTATGFLNTGPSFPPCGKVTMPEYAAFHQGGYATPFTKQNSMQPNTAYQYAAPQQQQPPWESQPPAVSHSMLPTQWSYPPQQYNPGNGEDINTFQGVTSQPFIQQQPSYFGSPAAPSARGSS